MKKIMLVGRTGAGKTTFCQAIHNEEIHYKKTQAVEVIDNTIDTPGEFMENRRLYGALMVTGADADYIVLLRDCTEPQTIFAPSFTSMFAKPAIGLVTKTDLAQNENQIKRSREDLEIAGCQKVFEISSVSGEGLDEVMQFLNLT